jgi:hypothetical protein
MNFNIMVGKVFSPGAGVLDKVLHYRSLSLLLKSNLGFLSTRLAIMQIFFDLNFLIPRLK